MPEELPKPTPVPEDIESMQVQLAQLVRRSLALREEADEIGGRMHALAGKISSRIFPQTPQRPEPANVIKIRPL